MTAAPAGKRRLAVSGSSIAVSRFALLTLLLYLLDISAAWIGGHFPLYY